MSLGLEPAVHLAELIRARQVSSRELLDLYLSRIESINPALNAVVTLDAERAQEDAARADEETTRGLSRGPLHGLPITVKDAIEVAGMRATGGSVLLADHVPPADAPAVGRLRDAGAVIFGKTNVPEWSADIQTFNSLFGTTRNPWDPELTPGGSSGGAAVAVATGLTAFELGTDIGGSVRIPASFCGVFGHKPSFGIIPQRGYLDRAGGGSTDADINVFGPIARSVADLRVLLGVLAGPPPEDAPAWRLDLPGPRHDELSGYRVGLWLDDEYCRVEGEAVELMQRAATGLAAAGAHVSGSRPALSLEAVDRLFTELELAAMSATFGPGLGDHLGGTHRNWIDLDRQRARLRAEWAAWFETHDVLLCPVMPMLPFPHDQGASFVDRRVRINGHWRPLSLAWTGLVGVAYLPSTVVPVGFTAGGLPVGLQVVGPYLGDRTTLFVAERLAQVTGGYVAPPVATLT